MDQLAVPGHQHVHALMKTLVTLWVSFIGWFFAIDYVPNNMLVHLLWLSLGVGLAMGIDAAYNEWQADQRIRRWPRS